jgi:hypothetical protein
VQDARVIIQFEARDETRPLQRDQFETLYRRITDEPDGFDLDRLPPDADPYPAVLSLHPRFEIDEDQGVIGETEDPITSQLLGSGDEAEPPEEERTEPDRIASSHRTCRGTARAIASPNTSRQRPSSTSGC